MNFYIVDIVAKTFLIKDKYHTNACMHAYIHTYIHKHTHSQSFEVFVTAVQHISEVYQYVSIIMKGKFNTNSCYHLVVY